MTENEDKTSWHATLYIWWGLLWRIGAWDFFFFILYNVTKTLTPQFYIMLNQAERDNEHLFLLLPIVANVIFAYFAVRRTYQDRFPTFYLAAEYKVMKRTAYAPDGKLPAHLAMQVWWAFVWRTMLIPAGVVAGHLIAGIIAHPRVMTYRFLINPLLLELSCYSLIVFSFWAAHESIRDHYPAFRFKTSAKRIYD